MIELIESLEVFWFYVLVFWTGICGYCFIVWITKKIKKREGK